MHCEGVPPFSTYRRGEAVTTSANTATVTNRDRFDFWHEVICSAFVRLEAETLPSERPFEAEIFSTDLGPLALSRVHAQPHTVHRSPSLIRDEPRDEVLVSLQLNGIGVVMQDDREAVLEAGDFALYDATRPYNLVMPHEFDMLVLQFNRQFLLERCPFPEPLTAVRMRSNGKVTAPVSSFLRSLEPFAFGEENAVSRQLATSALDLVGVALADHFGDAISPGSAGTKHFLRACTYINAYADDPDIDPSRIASSIGVSLRYLHQLFRDHNTTVTTYLMRRRLARCRDDLVCGQLGAKTVTEIALSHGFKTAAHFSRCFAAAYGATPTETRRAALLGSS